MKDINKKYESYKVAIKTEEDGYKFYKEGSEKAVNRLVKETFRSFAEDELKHKETIEKFYNSLEQNGELKTAEIFGVCNTLETAKTIFNRAGEAIGGSIRADSDVVEPYKMASRLENDGIKFYRELRDRTVNEEEKGLFGYLMRMEEAHKEILDNMIDYLENPGDWFFEQERWSIEG